MESPPVVVAVLNNKGGVGKTTTAVNLSVALASPSRRVLVVDLDSQAAASRWLGVRRGRLKPSSASVLLHEFPVAQAIRPTSDRGVDLISGSVDLASADVALAELSGREAILKNVLKPLRQRYNFVVLDCPASLSLLTVNAVVAADAIIIPVTPEHLAVEALGSLFSSIDMVRRRIGTRTRMLALLITMTEPRSGDHDVRARLREEYRERVFRAEVPVSRTLQEAAAAGQTIFAFAPRSRAADAFRRAAAELLERLGQAPSTD